MAGHAGLRHSELAASGRRKQGSLPSLHAQPHHSWCHSAVVTSHPSLLSTFNIDSAVRLAMPAIWSVMATLLAQDGGRCQ
jgi:hypothetical protein